MLYIEALIRAPVADVWRLTRDPNQHQQWDLRFSTIERYGADGRFRYTTRLLPGLAIAGIGVTAGQRERNDGTAVSALRFTCADPLSLIRRGVGFWRYIPTDTGVRFLTGYDYVPGWGRIGLVADRLFRPLFGWATAWSFDRLRLWLERGIPPRRSRNQALAEATTRLAIVIAAIQIGQIVGVLALTLVLIFPPLPGTPAARRCRRSYYARPTAVSRRARS